VSRKVIQGAGEETTRKDELTGPLKVVREKKRRDQETTPEQLARRWTRRRSIENLYPGERKKRHREKG